MFSHQTQSPVSWGKILFDPPIHPNLIPMWARSLLILCSVLHTCMLDRGVAYITLCCETGLKIHDTQEYNICFLSITDHLFLCPTVNITLILYIPFLTCNSCQSQTCLCHIFFLEHPPPTHLTIIIFLSSSFPVSLITFLSKCSLPLIS